MSSLITGTQVSVRPLTIPADARTSPRGKWQRSAFPACRTLEQGPEPSHSTAASRGSFRLGRRASRNLLRPPRLSRGPARSCTPSSLLRVSYSAQPRQFSLPPLAGDTLDGKVPSLRNRRQL